MTTEVHNASQGWAGEWKEFKNEGVRVRTEHLGEWLIEEVERTIDNVTIREPHCIAPQASYVPEFRGLDEARKYARDLLAACDFVDAVSGVTA